MTAAGQVVVAVDVGGTVMKCAIVDRSARVLYSERHATAAGRGPEAVVLSILDVLETLVDKARLDGWQPQAAGVVVPGVVDEAAGIAAWSSNLGFRDVPLRHRVAERLGLPVALGHDVRAGGLAEARLGAGRQGRHVLFVAIGTGIAAASILDGRMYTGAHGAAGELGHVLVRTGGPLCACGARGCLEAVASASALARRYAELAGTGRHPGDSVGPASPVGSASPAVSARTAASASTAASARAAVSASAAEVVSMAVAGDPVAGQAWREAIDALADGLLTAQSLFDPDTVVLGGGLAEAGEALFAPLRATLRARRTFHAEPRLVRATLGEEAGCLGAALLALDTLESGKDIEAGKDVACG